VTNEDYNSRIDGHITSFIDYMKKQKNKPKPKESVKPPSNVASSGLSQFIETYENTGKSMPFTRLATKRAKLKKFRANMKSI
jgi:hypothetical protein